MAQKSKKSRLRRILPPTHSCSTNQGSKKEKKKRAALIKHPSKVKRTLRHRLSYPIHLINFFLVH